MFESSKLHCRLHCLGVEVTNGYRGHVFRLGPCFFFPFHKPNYYECAFFLAKPTTHARVVRHTILKRNGKKKPWAQTNNSLPNNHVRHNEASFNSTKWRCPYDNVTYCKFTPNRKQLPKQLPPPLHMARTWMDMHRLRQLHDSQYIMKNPFTNENSNLSNIINCVSLFTVFFVCLQSCLTARSSSKTHQTFFFQKGTRVEGSGAGRGVQSAPPNYVFILSLDVITFPHPFIISSLPCVHLSLYCRCATVYVMPCFWISREWKVSWGKAHVFHLFLCFFSHGLEIACLSWAHMFRRAGVRQPIAKKIGILYLFGI